MYLTALTYQNLMADAKGPKQDMRHDKSFQFTYAVAWV